MAVICILQHHKLYYLVYSRGENESMVLIKNKIECSEPCVHCKSVSFIHHLAEKAKWIVCGAACSMRARRVHSSSARSQNKERREWKGCASATLGRLVARCSLFRTRARAGINYIMRSLCKKREASSGERGKCTQH